MSLLGLALIAGCGSSSLTESSAERPATPARPAGTSAMLNAVTKLEMISQDSCQLRPPEQVYPNCDRFMAELRSAVTTVRDGATALPNAEQVTRTASGLLEAEQAFDRDSCGAYRPSSGPPASDQACVADLQRVREGLRTLIEQTRGARNG